jgi:hypothetical protein
MACSLPTLTDSLASAQMYSVRPGKSNNSKQCRLVRQEQAGLCSCCLQKQANILRKTLCVLWSAGLDCTPRRTGLAKRTHECGSHLQAWAERELLRGCSAAVCHRSLTRRWVDQIRNCVQRVLASAQELCNYLVKYDK